MILKRLLPIVVFVALAAVAGAQEMFVPSGATFVDAAGPHETYQSLQAPPIEVTDLVLLFRCSWAMMLWNSFRSLTIRWSIDIPSRVRGADKKSSPGLTARRSVAK